MEEEKWYERIRDISKWKFRDFGLLMVIVVVVELSVLNAPDWIESIKCHRNLKQIEQAVEEKDYARAKELLKERTWFKSDFGLIDNYVYYCEELERTDDVLELYPYVESVWDDYDGLFAKELKEAKLSMQDEYKAAYAIYEEEQEKELLESLKTRIPYYGMPEKYINKTLMGPVDGHSASKFKRRKDKYESYKDEYWWKADNGHDSILRVICINGKVDTVKRLEEDVYWTKSGKPIFSATKSHYEPRYFPATNYANSKSDVQSKIDEFYDAQDYDDPEDFYLENEDEFYDFEDAEDYWSDYH